MFDIATRFAPALPNPGAQPLRLDWCLLSVAVQSPPPTATRFDDVIQLESWGWYHGAPHPVDQDRRPYGIVISDLLGNSLFVEAEANHLSWDREVGWVVHFSQDFFPGHTQVQISYWMPDAPPAQADDEVALALEDTLQTAIVISLFTDARAGQDDHLPRGQTDKRGWCGEEFVAPDAAPWGSKLWLLPAKAMPDVLERARFAAQEALAWLVPAGLAQRVSVDAEWHGQSAANQRLALRIGIYRGGQIKPVYDVLWGTSIARGQTQLQTSLYAGDAPRLAGNLP